jgi:esterase/lipase superfamily enzyme
MFMAFAYPYFQVLFNNEGAIFQQSEVDAVINALTGSDRPTDLLIMCHGWNNNIEDATGLYEALTGLIKTQVDANAQLKTRNYAVCGLLWPSKSFENSELFPRGAASLNEAVTTEDLKQRVRDLRSLYVGEGWPSADRVAPATFDSVEALMETIEYDPHNQEKAVDLLRELMPKEAASSEDGSDIFFSASTPLLINRLTKSLNPAEISAEAGAASLDPFSDGTAGDFNSAAGFRDLFGGVKAGFLHLLNFATYYLLKARADNVGVKGEAPLIVKFRDAQADVRVHLIGHSFGCRATAAAVNALPEDEKYRPDLLLLLQGTLSANVFAPGHVDIGADRGVFRDIVEEQKVRGPIIITHTHYDKAVGLAHPTASRMSGVTSSAFGDAHDKFGSLGRDGTPTTTPEGVAGALLPVGAAYPFDAGVTSTTIFNLKADDFIKDHSDIRRPEIAYAFTVAMAAEMNSSLVRVFFATNRKVSKILDENVVFSSVRTEDGGLSYGEFTVSIPKIHRKGKVESPSIVKFEFRPNPKKHIVLLKTLTFEEKEFLSLVRQTVGTTKIKQLLLFVHGYNVSFEDAARRTGQIAFDLQFLGATVLFSWPSRGDLLSYIADEATATGSVAAFKGFLELLCAESGAETIHVIAHSMGNRIVCDALQVLSAIDPTQCELQHLVLAAPDIDADAMRGLAPALNSKFGKVTLYQSDKDRAIAFSAALHKARRAGQPLLILPGIDTVDATNIDTDFLGHSIFSDTWALLADIAWLLHGQKNGTYRFGLDNIETVNGSYLRFRA